ncbi:MAG: HU family DNA-binding protein [Spirochaetales bacterium]|nr:HU family DNA-binding protein [Spirochaetales bacterium]
MNQSLENLSETIRTHLKSVTESSGLPKTEESFELIAQNWISKKKLFEEQTALLGLREIDHYEKDNPKGALLLTYSGSLLTVSPLISGKRWMEYASIKLRADVPSIAYMENCYLGSDIKVDSEAEIVDGKIKRTSALLKITTFEEDLKPSDQEQRLREASIFLTNRFTKENQSILLEADQIPNQFNMKEMINFIAQKNNLTQKVTKQLIDDYLLLVESGVLLGERVSLGRLGKMFLKKRPAQKARMGVNPATQEKIMINAKPEMAVPRVSCSKHLKDRAALIDPQKLEPDNMDSDE